MAIFSLIIASLPFTGAVTLFGLSPAISAAIINVGKALLWNALSVAVGPKAPKQQVQASIAQAVAPRVRGYGTYRLGGVKAFREAKDKKLHQITVSHHTPIDGIEYFEINGEQVTLSGGTSGEVTSGDANGYVWIYPHLSGDGGDFADVRTAFPTMWTTNHKLTNQATYYTVMKAPKPERMAKRFPRGAETSITVVARLSQVIDPRDMSFGFTNLTGPIALDYLTHEDGYRIPIGSIDLNSFAAFTDVCDEDVALKAGGTEKRYTAGGYYTLEDAPKDVIGRILETADAQLYMTPEGKVGVLGGRWHDPDVTISWEDILSMDLDDAFDEFTDFNTLKGTYTSPLHRFQDTEVDELRDETALLTQPERVTTHEVEMCPSPSQLRRLMYLYRARKIRRFTGTMRTNLVGMKARFPRGDGPHVINVYDPGMDIDMVFEVLSHNYSTTEKFCEIAIATLDNAYPWDPVTQEGNPPPPFSDLDTPATESFIPTGLILTQDIVTLASEQNEIRIRAEVDDPGIEGVQLYLEYRELGDTLWVPMVVGLGDLWGLSGLVSANTTYEVRASWVSEDGYTPVSLVNFGTWQDPNVWDDTEIWRG